MYFDVSLDSSHYTEQKSLCAFMGKWTNNTKQCTINFIIRN